MNKAPPNRRGIIFEVGAALEARDSQKNWYAANIEKIDYEDEKVLVHYRQWSHRYDEWFDWTSPYLRPMERVQLRREGLQEDGFIPGFHVNDKVLASWSDCRFYPAKVLAVNKDASYTVKFFDGVIQTVKGIHVKPFSRERRKKLTDRNGEKQVKKTEKDKKLQEINGRGKDMVGQADRVPEEEEGEVSDGDREKGEKKKRRIQSGNTGHKDREHREVENMSVTKENEDGERVLDQIRQHNYCKLFLKDSGHAEAMVKTEADSMVIDSRVKCNEGGDKGNEIEEAEVQVEQKEEEMKGQVLPCDRKSRRRRIRGKRRLSVARKRKKTDSNSDKGFHNDFKPTPALTNQRPQGKGTESAPLLVIQPSNGTKMPKAQCQSETSKQTVRKQAFRNPNRFSREPLYRVIRNQPPSVVAINLDHNPYKCSASGCKKSFRKAKLLHYHMKYYHGDDRAIDEDLCMNEGKKTSAMDKQAALINQDGCKRRCIALSSLREFKAGAQMTVKRCSAAPPVVSAQNYLQWPLLKKKTREPDGNIQRGFNKGRERRVLEMGVKEHDRLKEKMSRDLLRIKLKSKKKMRKTTSDEDSISDWSSDSFGWSEDEIGADLDIGPSPLSCSSVASTTGSGEIVRCVCEVEEEIDFMLQCEECQYWQHGTCMGLLEENIPERYACFLCRDSPGQVRGQRSSLRYWYDRDWLSSGHMYGLSFLKNYSHQNGKKIATTHQLLGDVQHVVEVLNGLQLKISVLQSQAHPDLKMWRQPWKLAERSRMKSTALLDAKTVSSLAPSEAALCKEPLPSSFQDYISSEHCYQKPLALHQVLEPNLILKTQVGTELEDRLHNTERLLKNGQHNNGEIQPALLKTFNTQLSNHSKHEVGADGGGVKGGAQQQQWRINLLEHIETVQEDVIHRMDFIERELDVLENWLDCTGELEPPEPLDRLPELKHSIKQLLNELGKVQQIALACAT
ncbi:PHD finger protein 20 isoform X2 [Myxocyprinus asiaticus]|uniref:PHD finger protein 20 isoform X2 n=1 Tax=Myxocyprinus asiaticus TaxID=70543 RepID=UPI002223E7E9|nr:PHD finger protein 20 isoform X2 [Myxocyprinus asiaticus]